MAIWEMGQQSDLARLAGVKQEYINMVLHRKRSVNPLLAKKLEVLSEIILGFSISFEDWVLSKYSNNPAFYGEPLPH